MSGSQLAIWSPPTRESAYPQHGRPASGPPQTRPRVHPWHQHSQSAAGSSEAMEETDSTEVKYKIRQWSLPGATIVPVLNVSSRIFWLELWQSSLGQLFGSTGGYPVRCVFAEVFSCMAGRSWRKAHSWYRSTRPSRCGWLAEFHVVAEEPMAYLYNSRNSHWGDLWPGLQQRAAQAGGQTSVDGGQTTVGGACRPDVRQSPHREVQKRTGCSALRQGRQTQPHWPIWREKVSWARNQRSPGMVEAMPGLDGTI